MSDEILEEVLDEKNDELIYNKLINVLEFDIEFYENYIFFKYQEKLFLIDTGSSTSTSCSKIDIEMIDETYTLNQNYTHAVFENFKEYINREDLFGIIGMNILSKYDIIISLKKSKIIFYKKNTIEFSEFCNKIETNDNLVLFIYFQLENETKKFIFDSSSKISYLEKSMNENKEIIKEIDDFNAFLGTFKSNVYEYKVNISNFDVVLEFSSLHDILSSLLIINKCDGVLGSNFLKNCLEFRFSCSQEKFELKYS
jgi:hypothetical protein